ncbi:hypothetical protein GL4_3303 [Methyloceanibacter caenitepidi]|uniref:Uncharacterized protein n=1 Tax=Methyloceanibacter caenitepidi TaxID=1384459 RepID=A0A0A8K707_9HYPH|nr:hypothetical protein GL4_3303 [Methyloceanibacter caenitepidi]
MLHSDLFDLVATQEHDGGMTPHVFGNRTRQITNRKGVLLSEQRLHQVAKFDRHLVAIGGRSESENFVSQGYRASAATTIKL